MLRAAALPLPLPTTRHQQCQVQWIQTSVCGKQDTPHEPYTTAGYCTCQVQQLVQLPRFCNGYECLTPLATKWPLSSATRGVGQLFSRSNQNGLFCGVGPL